MAERGTPLLGIFVGGRSRRMGGQPKGRLPSPTTGAPLIVALAHAGRAAGLEPVLVGDASPYADLVPDVPRLADDPPGVGPLGGLSALLAHAGEGRAVAVACDMPHVTAEVLADLWAQPAAPVVAARRTPDGPWEPLLARYDAPSVAPFLRQILATGERSFQGLLGRLQVHPWVPTGEAARTLEDWDRPEDVG
jgi:molybdenum cofactor guanylyltransferase